MKYLVLAFTVYFFIPSSRVQAADVFHFVCGDGGEMKISGPVSQVHAECSKDLDPVSEKNLCEMQCFRIKEGLNGADGKPDMEKHIAYVGKTMDKVLNDKAVPIIKGCFEKHGASLPTADSDKMCEKSKDFNTCLKTAMMDICNVK